jgi:hypothetical protein
MPGTGAMASLAIDSFRERVRVDRNTVLTVVPGGYLRVSIMAEDTFVGDLSWSDEAIGVISRIHRPEAVVFGIPG